MSASSVGRVLAALGVGLALVTLPLAGAQAATGSSWLSPLVEAIEAAQGQSTTLDAGTPAPGSWIEDVAEVLTSAQAQAARPDAAAAVPGLIELGPDSSWLGGSETGTLKGMAGGLMAGGLVVAVGALVVAAAAWGAQRIGWLSMNEKAQATMGWSVLGSVVLGSLSGLVGFSFTLA